MSDPINNDENNPLSEAGKKKIAAQEFAIAVELEIKKCEERISQIIANSAQLERDIEDTRKKYQYEIANKEFSADMEQLQLAENKRIWEAIKQLEELEKQRRVTVIILSFLVDTINNLKNEIATLEKAHDTIIKTVIANTIEDIASIQFFKKNPGAKAIALTLLKPLNEALEKGEVDIKKYRENVTDMTEEAVKLFIAQLPPTYDSNGRHSIAKSADIFIKSVRKESEERGEAYQSRHREAQKINIIKEGLVAELKSKEALHHKVQKGDININSISKDILKFIQHEARQGTIAPMIKKSIENISDAIYKPLAGTEQKNAINIEIESKVIKDKGNADAISKSTSQNAVKQDTTASVVQKLKESVSDAKDKSLADAAQKDDVNNGALADEVEKDKSHVDIISEYTKSEINPDTFAQRVQMAKEEFSDITHTILDTKEDTESMLALFEEESPTPTDQEKDINDSGYRGPSFHQ